MTGVKKVVNAVARDDVWQSNFPFCSDAYLASHGIRIFSQTEEPELTMPARRVERLLVMEVTLGRCNIVRMPRTCVNEWGGFALLLVVAGEIGVLGGSAGSVSCESGDVLLLSMEEEYSVTSCAGTHLTVVVMATESPITKVPIITACVGNSVKPADTFPVQMLSSYVATLIHGANRPERSLLGTAERHIADLITLTFSAVSLPALSFRGAKSFSARFGRILVYIRANIRDPDLTVHSVAKYHNISNHYVRKLFYEANTSFTAYVTELRLNWAHQCLSASMPDELRIADVAFQAGFNNLGWFNRAFKRRYGLTPSALRSRCQEQPA